MSLLSDLPDDILGLISIRLNGFDNCSLWMASDSKLKQRLVNNVITDFDIKYTTPGRYLWPGNFLKKLKRLSRLSLVVTHTHLPIENVELFPIPTLKYFEMICPKLVGLFEEFELSKILAHVSRDLGHASSSFSQYSQISFYYPNLEHFKISPQSYLPLDFFCALPRNLKTLSIPFTELEIDHPEDDMKGINATFGVLPPTLTSLELTTAVPLGDSNPIDAYYFPPNLTSLTINAEIDYGTLEDLPKTLKHFDSSNNLFFVQYLAPHLPIGLESLKVESYAFDLACLSHLRHLTSLYLTADLEEDDSSLKLAPFRQGLLELSLFIEQGFNREFFQTLPKTLTKLDLYQNGPPQPFEFFSLFPKTLKSFKTNLSIIENLSLLPESITLLELDCTKMSDLHFDRLPPNLQNLTLFQVDLIPHSILKELPESLERLLISSDATVIDDEIIASLPRGLKLLSLDALFDMTDATTRLLPPNLEFLTVTIQGDDKLTDAAIAHLPRNLTQLRLHRVTNLTDDCIPHMPRNLIVLSLPHCHRLTSKCSPYLPRYLSQLMAPGCKDWVTDELEDPPKWAQFTSTRRYMRL